MNGPQHYAEAESLLEAADQMADVLRAEAAPLSGTGLKVTLGVMSHVLAAAQVHATLAHSMATLQAGYGDVNTVWGRIMRGAS